MARRDRGILVTGGGTFLGDNIASALLAAGCKVSLLVRPGGEDKLGPLAQQTRWSSADVWSPASLSGKARYHTAVIHTVGSLTADTRRGLSFERLNFVSARNVANMCVSDGVARMVLISGVGAPWVSRAYIRSKRNAEDYLVRVGLQAQIVRAPLLYVPGARRPLFYRAISVLGALPPLSWLFFGRAAPIPIDALARGVASISMDEAETGQIFYSADLRRHLQRSRERESGSVMEQPGLVVPKDDGPFDSLDEDLPFGWSPRDGQS